MARVSRLDDSAGEGGRPQADSQLLAWPTSQWEDHELKALELGLELFGHDLEKVAVFVGTKAPQEVVVYAQRYMGNHGIALGGSSQPQHHTSAPQAETTAAPVRALQKRKHLETPKPLTVSKLIKASSWDTSSPSSHGTPHRHNHPTPTSPTGAAVVLSGDPWDQDGLHRKLQLPFHTATPRPAHHALPATAIHHRSQSDPANSAFLDSADSLLSGSAQRLFLNGQLVRLPQLPLQADHQRLLKQDVLPLPRDQLTGSQWPNLGDPSLLEARPGAPEAVLPGAQSTALATTLPAGLLPTTSATDSLYWRSGMQQSEAEPDDPLLRGANPVAIRAPLPTIAPLGCPASDPGPNHDPALRMGRRPNIDTDPPPQSWAPTYFPLQPLSVDLLAYPPPPGAVPHLASGRQPLAPRLGSWPPAAHHLAGSLCSTPHLSGRPPPALPQPRPPLPFQAACSTLTSARPPMGDDTMHSTLNRQVSTPFPALEDAEDLLLR